MIEALLLGRQYGYGALKEALEKALDLSCFDVEALRLLLSAERSGKREPSVEPAKPIWRRDWRWRLAGNGSGCVSPPRPRW